MIFNKLVTRDASRDDATNAPLSKAVGISKIHRWKRVMALMNAYSLENLIRALKRLSSYLLHNGINSGNILVKIVSFPALLCVILVLQAALLIKRLFRSVYRIVQNMLKFLNMCLTILVEEIKFYWKLAYRAGKALMKSEKYLYRKMLEHCQMLWQEIFHDVSVVSLQYAQLSYSTIFLDILRKFGSWMCMTLLACMMTILMIGLPFTVPLSIHFRGGKMTENDADDELIDANT